MSRFGLGITDRRLNAALLMRIIDRWQELEGDESMEWASIKRMDALYNAEYDWRLFRRTSLEMGIERRETFYQKHGSVKSYHQDVCMEAYGIKIITGDK